MHIAYLNNERIKYLNSIKGERGYETQIIKFYHGLQRIARVRNSFKFVRKLYLTKDRFVNENIG